MKVHVLVDNNTLIDRYFIGEPGVAFFIEEGELRILFDTGYSDAFIKNAQKMNIDLLNLDYVVLSHGHVDHTWGLVHLISLFNEAIIEKKTLKKPTLVAHPEVFAHKFFGEETIGSLLDLAILSRFFNLKLTANPFEITAKLMFLGEIVRTNDFENREPVGKCLCGGAEVDDFVLDDSALVYKGRDGISIITGCSHSGICNIVEHAKKLCNTDQVSGILGGLHLLNPNMEKLKKTTAYIQSLGLTELHACHCTDLSSKIALSQVVKMADVGVGLKIEI